MLILTWAMVLEEVAKRARPARAVSATYLSLDTNYPPANLMRLSFSLMRFSVDETGRVVLLIDHGQFMPLSGRQLRCFHQDSPNAVVLRNRPMQHFCRRTLSIVAGPASRRRRNGPSSGRTMARHATRLFPMPCFRDTCEMENNHQRHREGGNHAWAAWWPR
jgi:hypothetical protein